MGGTTRSSSKNSILKSRLAHGWSRNRLNSCWTPFAAGCIGLIVASLRRVREQGNRDPVCGRDRLQDVQLAPPLADSEVDSCAKSVHSGSLRTIAPRFSIDARWGRNRNAPQCLPTRSGQRRPGGCASIFQIRPRPCDGETDLRWPYWGTGCGGSGWRGGTGSDDSGTAGASTDRSTADCCTLRTGDSWIKPRATRMASSARTIRRTHL